MKSWFYRYRLLAAGIVAGALATIATPVGAQFMTGAARLAETVVGAVGPKQVYRLESSDAIDATTLDAASTSFSRSNAGISDGAWGLMTIHIQITDADNSVTAISMACTNSFDNNSTDYALQDCTVASGTATCVDLAWTHNPSAATSPKRWSWRIDVEGLEDYECTFTDTGGDASDSIDVRLAYATKG